jgi:galactokinase
MTEGKAHGRVNLIGEHMDYNDGFVLPAAIPHHAVVQLTPRTDNRVQLKSHDVDTHAGSATADYELGHETKRSHWSDYIQGITKILAHDGHKIKGFTADLRSSVPIGSGLSSSAADRSRISARSKGRLQS